LQGGKFAGIGEIWRKNGVVEFYKNKKGETLLLRPLFYIFLKFTASNYPILTVPNNKQSTAKTATPTMINILPARLLSLKLFFLFFFFFASNEDSSDELVCATVVFEPLSDTLVSVV
jgi:hypothetical protein